MNYSKKIQHCRSYYPFKYWSEDYQDGIGKYSDTHCFNVQSIFDGLLKSLISLGEAAPELSKVELFQSTVQRLNIVRKNYPELIETMEREEFCDLFDKIALAAGLRPENYGGGDGIASEWREW
ncbi:hypothetical protein [Leucothrix arctica]|uniref:Uncharacterized protein n=1 Tax=Leucothrix arctica TaxID=1481894 RepID=A0A317CA78_9GAMM|nr:hypothetical protein [Leucothrix arctica]PWQ95051.1 hypothetical protein DKT75_13605 [Leucothrix arctica]